MDKPYGDGFQVYVFESSYGWFCSLYDSACRMLEYYGDFSLGLAVSTWSETNNTGYTG